MGTTIKISVDLRDKLVKEKLTKSETYDEIINRLLYPKDKEVDFQ